MCYIKKAIEYVGATFKYDKRVVFGKKLFSKRISQNGSDNELRVIPYILFRTLVSNPKHP